MILFRCVSDRELERVLIGETVYGRFNNSKEYLNDSNIEQAVCFFAEKAAWLDKYHRYVLVLDIDEKDLEMGEGTYYIPSNFKNTKIWTGRDGYQRFVLKEAYKDKYEPSDVKGIFLLNNLRSRDMRELVEENSSKFYINDTPQKHMWKNIYSFIDTLSEGEKKNV